MIKITKYTKNISDFFYCPSNPESNFLNDSGGAIQAFAQSAVLPYCLVTEDLPLILPKRQDEGASGVGEGVNETVVLESQFSIGAGSIVNQAINFLMIPRLGGDVTITEITAEVWTVVAVAPTSITTSTYICFDVISAAGAITKYYGWFDKNGDGVTDKPAAPTCYGGTRTAVQFNISGDASAQDVSDTITAAITALDNVSAANGGGTSTTCTVTNAQNGAVDDAYDYNSGLTISISTQGVTKAVISLDATSFEQQNFGFQFQSNNGANDRLYTLTGITIAEHTLQCEHDGMMTEDINYMVAGLKEQYGALSVLSKMRNPYGVLWTTGISPYGNKSAVKNHSWATLNENFTFTHNGTPYVLTWMGIKIAIENELSHDRDGGGEFASGVNLNKRNIRVTPHIQTEDYYLYQHSRQHYTEYDGDILIQVKSMQAGDNNVYVQFDCDKLRVLPIDELIKGDGSPEEYDVDLTPAPGATTTYTIQGYLSNEYFGGVSS